MVAAVVSATMNRMAAATATETMVVMAGEWFAEGEGWCAFIILYKGEKT